MTRERVDLHGSEQTLLMSLYLHALDAREESPVLGDEWAQRILDGVDFDPSEFDSIVGNEELIVERARIIDVRVRDFLSDHPGATVARLGCGLDSRSARIDHQSARWIDIDLPEVIEMRRKLYPDTPGVEMLPASASETQWWDAVADARPLLIVAEGLLMYLDQKDVDALLRRAEQWRGGGTMIFDSVAPWVVRASRLQPAMRKAGTGFRSSFDADDVTKRFPGLRARRTESVTATLGTDSPKPAWRAAYRVFDLLRPLRMSMVVRELQLPMPADPDNRPPIGGTT